jgi:hypothetical protein
MFDTKAILLVEKRIWVKQGAEVYQKGGNKVMLV